jgi:hypothetical protein
MDKFSESADQKSKQSIQNQFQFELSNLADNYENLRLKNSLKRVNGNDALNELFGKIENKIFLIDFLTACRIF